MDTELRALRKKIAKTEPNARGRRRYSEEVRTEIVEHTLKREESGSSQAEIAQDLGLSHRTLWGWLRRQQMSVVRPVELIDDHTEREPLAGARALVFPNGSRIEGLSLDDVVTLVRASS